MVKLGRMPERVSAARVNWLTSSRPPPVSRSERFIFPAVGEYPVAQQALGHPPQLGLGIARLHADQGQQARADLPHGLIVDMDGGLADTLDQDEHRGLPMNRAGHDSSALG